MTTEVMRQIDHDYRESAGVSAPGQYKIFYSRINPFPLLVLGQNPGGAEDGPSLVASSSFFENWEHDIPCFRTDQRYSLARPLCDLLAAALRTQSVNVLRQVPMTNLIFRRSRNTASLKTVPLEAAREAKPFLSRIIEAVKPEAILLISSTAFDIFTRLHCRAGTVVHSSARPIFTPNGRYNAAIYRRAEAYVEILGKTVPLLTVGHPSKYGARPVWGQVTQALTKALVELQIVPFRDSIESRALPPLAGYGTSLNRSEGNHLRQPRYRPIQASAESARADTRRPAAA